VGLGSKRRNTGLRRLIVFYLPGEERADWNFASR
jgi:hypothetical protein